jgi:hypothetical protein
MNFLAYPNDSEPCNPAKFVLSYLLIDVHLTGRFPQLFIRYNPGPPDLHDISQAFPKLVKGNLML